MMGDDDPEGLKAYHEETKDYGGGEENANGYIGCTSRIPMEQHRDGWVAEQCLKFLDEGWTRRGRCFCICRFLSLTPDLTCRRNSRTCTG
ncbi:hypothetical protein LJK87_41915 [Paenibacillus sp. P25]|nr:hypothetical protein LJK87_41915 [Paenibacillus sp. P25]